MSRDPDSIWMFDVAKYSGFGLCVVARRIEVYPVDVGSQLSGQLFSNALVWKSQHCVLAEMSDGGVVGTRRYAVL